MAVFASTTNQTHTISDSQGNSYTERKTVAQQGEHSAYTMVPASSGSLTITCTAGGSTAIAMGAVALGFSGLSYLTGSEKTMEAVAGTTHFVAPGMTTAVPAILFFWLRHGASHETPDAGWTQLHVHPNDGAPTFNDYVPFNLAYRIETAGGTYTPGWTPTNAGGGEWMLGVGLAIQVPASTFNALNV